MVEYKAYLKLKLPRQQDNIMGLSWERYEVVNCEYEFIQGVNREGEVNGSGITGGTINLSVSDLPTKELMVWVFDHYKKFNGEITICDLEGETLEQVYFEEARCVDFKLSYRHDRKPYSLTKLTLLTERMQVGDTYFEF